MSEATGRASRWHPRCRGGVGDASASAADGRASRWAWADDAADSIHESHACRQPSMSFSPSEATASMMPLPTVVGDDADGDAAEHQRVSGRTSAGGCREPRASARALSKSTTTIVTIATHYYCSQAFWHHFGYLTNLMYLIFRGLDGI